MVGKALYDEGLGFTKINIKRLVVGRVTSK